MESCFQQSSRINDVADFAKIIYQGGFMSTFRNFDEPGRFESNVNLETREMIRDNKRIWSQWQHCINPLKKRNSNRVARCLRLSLAEIKNFVPLRDRYENWYRNDMEGAMILIDYIKGTFQSNSICRTQRRNIDISRQPISHGLAYQLLKSENM